MSAMSIVGGYPMPQSYGPGSMGHADAFYYSHPSPPSQALYSGWGNFGYTHGYDMSGCGGDYGGAFMLSPSSPQDYTIEMIDGTGRVVKRRTSANKKERRRTQSINNAFAELRECIPNVPADTKLSKIKTLRLATSYIAYLMEVLRSEDAPPEGFKADIPSTRKHVSLHDKHCSEADKCKRGRTGWPQAVWAQELKK